MASGDRYERIFSEAAGGGLLGREKVQRTFECGDRETRRKEAVTISDSRQT